MNQLKSELVKMVKATGLNSNDALFSSQKLNQHITVCQKIEK